jgi:hypothetical protein
MVEGQWGEDRGRGDSVKIIRGGAKIRRDIPSGHGRSGYRYRDYRYGVGRQGTDPVDDFGNGRGVRAAGQVVVGQGMVIDGGESKAGCEVTGIRG